MKQYIKNIMILILALPWGLLLTNCSDSESDYSDDNAYPPPTVELTSPSEIDVVEYNSTVTVSAKSFSAVGIHSIYATLLKMDENGEYEEINATERQRLKIDTLQTDMTLEFDLNVKVNTLKTFDIDNLFLFQPFYIFHHNLNSTSIFIIYDSFQNKLHFQRIA